MRTEVTVCQELYRAMVIHELLSVLMLTKALFPHYLELTLEDFCQNADQNETD